MDDARRFVSGSAARLAQNSGSSLPPLTWTPKDGNDGDPQRTAPPLPPLGPSPARKPGTAVSAPQNPFDVCTNSLDVIDIRKPVMVDQAIAACDRAIDLQRKNGSFSGSIGLALFRAELQLIRGKFPEALSAARSAWQWNENRVLARSIEIRALTGLGQIPDAEKSANELIQRAPDRPEPYFARATISMKRGNTGKAITDYRKALTLQPVSWQKRQIVDALRSLNVPLDPTDAAKADWAICKDDNAPTADLIEACGRIISFPVPGLGNEYLPYYSRGLAYFQIKDFRNAIPDLTEAIKRWPADHIYYLRAQAYEKVGYFAVAMADYEKLLSTSEQSVPQNETVRKQLEAMRKHAKERFDYLASQGYIVPPPRPR